MPHPGIGPELGIGHVLGDFFEEPVLLIKAAWGGRSVKYSFRPPSAMPSDEIIRKQVNEIEANRKKPLLGQKKLNLGVRNPKLHQYLEVLRIIKMIWSRL